MEPDKSVEERQSNTTFYIVGIGASAGGLHPFECFLEALPRDFDFAVVFIQHLSPTHKNLMPEILRSKWHDCKFIEIEDGLGLLPGRIYLCPPAIEVRIHEGIFRITAKPDEHIHFPIDELLVSLAEYAAERAVAVIFSGAGNDGVRGIQAVRTEGGTVFVQDPATAQFPELPQAAIKTGRVDSVLPPPDIAREIVKLFNSTAVTQSTDNLINPTELESFYLLIRERTGLRFNHYKKSVISRRIRRRMQLQGIYSVSEYLNVVADKPGEVALLASDLMIGVTSFFRDRLAWKAMRIEVIRKMAAEGGDAPIRVWTPACATGEESYSIAMMLRHELDLAGGKKELQVFATDVNDSALEKAREGKYPASIAADVPDDYLRDYLTYSDDGLTLTISKELRQHVIFAKQDLLTDPPFSRLDLVICRNLLIYLEPEAQEKCITLFHYALRAGGYLFLGNAESPGRNSTLFKSLAHKRCRVYEKIDIEQSTRLPLTIPFSTERATVPIRHQPSLDQRHSIIQLSQETLLEGYAPAAVTIDQNYYILYHNGPTKRYLTQPRGITTQNLLELIPEKLRNKIRGAIYKVTKDGKPVSIRAGIAEGERQERQVSVLISKMKDNLFLVVFREKAGQPSEASPETLEPVCVEEPAVRQLEIELSATRQELQTNIEQLKSLNEEQQSSNEELQAANEELETSREELQSLNEELITVNAQLQSKVEEQEETNNDLNNFFGSTNIPTIFLDRSFRVKRYTAAITKLIKLIPSDVGRHIIDMSQELLGKDLIGDAKSVLENLLPVKKEIRINDTWYVRTALPYRTLDDRIEGVVVTYNDVTVLKQAEENAILAKEEWERTFASVPDLIVILDNQHRVLRVNEAMASRLGRKPEDCIGLHCYDAVHGLSAPPAFCPHARTIEDGKEHIEEVREERLGGDFLVSTTPLHDEQGQMIGSVHVAHDITARKQAELELERLGIQRQLALDAAHMGWWHYDPITRIATWDEGYKNIFGVTGNQSPNEEILKRIHPEDLPGVWAKVEAALDPVNPQPYVAEYRINLPDGSLRWIEAHGIATFEGIGKNRLATSFVGTVADITERRQAEEALRESSQRNAFLASVVQSASQPFGQGFPDGRLGLINKAFEQLTGYSENELRSMDWARVLTPPEWQEFERQKLEELQRSGKPVRYEKEYIRKDGTRVPIELLVHLVTSPDGNPLYYYSFLTDITERKKAEETLGRLSAIVESADDAIISKDLNGIIQTWNIGAENIFGYKAEEVVGKNVSLLVPPGYVDEVPGIIAQIKQGEHIENFETVRMRKDGTIIPVSLTFSAVKDASGRIIGASEIAHDISERKRAEDLIRRQVEELVTANEELQRFNRAAVGRELRMVELKKEVNELRAKLDQPGRYKLDFGEEQP
jgi:two-component system, chemotaxis family, CheB/CheR fusion protein